MKRREFLSRGAAAATLLLGAPEWLRERVFAMGNPPGIEPAVPGPPGTPYPLVALPGKAPMGQVYDRPPNYETPTPHLIGSRHHPYTDAEYYVVRYREASVPYVDPERFRLVVGGDSVRHKLVLTLDDLRGFPQVDIGAVGNCTGLGRGLLRPLVPGLPWTKGDLSCARWSGASLRAVLHEAGVLPGAIQVAFRAAGRLAAATKPEYWRVYPLATALRPEGLLATRMNGGDMPLWNGFPLRLVMPGAYSPMWVKQLVEIQVRSTPHPMEWSGRAMTPGTIRIMSLMTDPPDGTVVQSGSTVAIRGVAWDSGHGIERVEVSTDDGRSWERATIERSYGKYVWRVWHHRVVARGRGTLRVLTRATGVTGETQPMDVSERILRGGGRKNTAVRTFAGVLVIE